MKRPFFFKTIRLALGIMCLGISAVQADTITGDLYSRPLSVSLPGQLSGGLYSQGVSVSLPLQLTGGLFSRPVSISLPTQLPALAYTAPISVAVQPQSVSGDTTLVPTLDPTASPTNQLSVTLSGSKHTNSYLYINRQRTDISYPSPSWSYTLPLQEGNNSILIFTLDSSGTQSESVTADIVRDTTPPNLTVSAIPTQSYTNNSTFNVSGTVQYANLAQLTVNGNAVAVTPSGTFSTAIGLQEGENTVNVVATDLAGNTTTDSRTVYLDGTAPVITIDSPTDLSYTKTTPLTVTGSLDHTGTVTVAGVPAAISGTNFSANVDLSQGLNTIDVVATDLAQNVSHAKRTVILDTISPEVAITDPVQDITVSDPVLEIHGTASDADPITLTKTFNGVTTAITLQDGKFSFAVDFSDLDEGVYPIKIQAADTAGNVSTIVRNVILNRNPVFTVDPFPTPTNQSDLVLTGTMPAGATVSLSCSTATVGAVSYPTPTTWQAEISRLSENRNTVLLSASSAGETLMIERHLFYDRIPPALTIDQLSSPSGTQVITGTREAGATITVSNDGTTAGEVSYPTETTWSSTVSGMTSTGTTLDIRATDTAGNTAEVSLKVSAGLWDGTFANRLAASSADYDYTYGDESSLTYRLPWPFRFHGTSYSEINVDTNGDVWFGSSGAAHSFNLANTGRGGVIAAWNNDLSSYFYGGVFVQHKNNPERVVIEWQTETYTEEGSSTPNNFEVVLYPNGAIRADYKSFATASTSDFGSGISDGTGMNHVSLTSSFGKVYTLAGRSFEVGFGTPKMEVSPATPTFAVTSVNATSLPATVAIRNRGTQPLDLASVQIGGEAAAEFVKIVDNCSGQALASSASCNVQLAFSPTSSGQKIAQMTVSSNDPYSPVYSVQLSGTSVVPTLAVTKAGTGEGSVTSDTGGISCGVSCSATYSADTAVTLTPMPAAGSIFSGWSGDCSGIGGCTVSMASSRTITAWFSCQMQPVRILAENAGYPSLAAALAAANEGDVIQLQAGALVETVDIDKAVTIDGGYNCDYSAKSGITRLKGDVTVESGSAQITDVIIDSP